MNIVFRHKKRHLKKRHLRLHSLCHWNAPLLTYLAGDLIPNVIFISIIFLINIFFFYPLICRTLAALLAGDLIPNVIIVLYLIIIIIFFLFHYYHYYHQQYYYHYYYLFHNYHYYFYCYRPFMATCTLSLLIIPCYNYRPYYQSYY